MGGLLTLGSFTKTFPEIDLTKKGVEGLTSAQKSQQSNVQGEQLL